MAAFECDPGIRTAVCALNRLRGVETRASCQGKNPGDAGTSHADLAYVTFADPIPLLLERHLVVALASLARVEPTSIYSRWTDRNAELCRELAEASRSFRSLASPIDDSLAGLEAELIDRLRATSAPALFRCLDCEVYATPDDHVRCHVVPLLEEDPERRRRLLDGFFADDPSPPDPRLREREGDAALVERIERGDFGERYTERWRSHLVSEARRIVRSEIRATLGAFGENDPPVDLLFEAGHAILVRESPE